MAKLGKRLRRSLKATLQGPLSRLLLFGSRPPSSQLRDAEFRRILVLRPDNRLGNLILVTPLLQGLRKRFPRSSLYLWTGRRFAPLLGRSKDIDGILTSSGSISTGRDIGMPGGVRGLRGQPWDLAVSTVLPGATSMSGSLLMAWSCAHHRIGFDHPRSRASLTHALPPPSSQTGEEGRPGHAATEMISLLQCVGVDPADSFSAPTLPRMPPAVVNLSALFPRGEEPGGRRRVLVHTGGRRDKAWSAEAFRRVSEGLSQAGHVVCVARGPDTEVWEPGDDPNIVFLPAMGVTDFAHVLSEVDHFLGCDTGVMHMAAALGTPATAIFRTSDPRRYAPVGQRHTVLVLGPRSEDYLSRGGWPSLPGAWTPDLRVAPGGIRDAEPMHQVDWVLGQLLSNASLQPREKPSEEVGHGPPQPVQGGAIP